LGRGSHALSFAFGIFLAFITSMLLTTAGT
jgi:hypothetical protein